MSLENPITESEHNDLLNVVIRRGLSAVVRTLEQLERAMVESWSDIGDAPRAAAHLAAADSLAALAAQVDPLADEADPGWGPGPNLAFFVDPSNTGGGTH